MINPEIINDISLLYELSLSLGKSHDIKENAGNFISTLMRRKGLSYASLWIKAEKLSHEEESGFYKRIYAYPHFRAGKQYLSFSHEIHSILEKNEVYVVESSDPVFQDFYHNEGEAMGKLAFLKLGDVGFLKLYSFSKKDTLKHEQLYKLNKVLDQFTHSLRACMVHGQLKKEIQDRKKVEKELRTSKEAEEQFFANMSHEIRTPINGMLGMMNLMGGTQLTEEQREYLNDMILSSKTLLSILNDILDFSKIQQGKIIIEQVRFDLIGRLRSQCNMAQSRADQGKLNVKLDLGVNVPQFVAGDQFRFDQVMNNLISNALKFTEEGEINIVAKFLGEENGMDLYLFKVEDTGIGIPEEKQESIFSSFVQAEAYTSRMFGGTGLGLPIVKQLLELMGGEIRLDSEPGEGSSFYFTLPLGRVSQEAGTHSKDRGLVEKGSQLKGYHILLVEDTPMNQKVGVRMLKKWGAGVEIAENGLLGFEKCRDKKFDLVLMDLQMPVMSGYEAAIKIRNELPTPKSKVPIIALTAAVRETVKRKVLESGMDSYVMKPFEPDNLLGIIKFYLMKRAKKSLDTRYEDQATASIDTSYLEEIADGDVQFIEDMINLFKDQAPLELDSLGHQINAQDWEQIHQHTHKLKYPYTSIGRLDLVQKLAVIEENTLKSRNIKLIQDAYDFVKRETAIILDQLNSR
ncbi:MAG: ATP-binding protein [Bacteroidia bacterium]|nr:ATP-binding protein [Bacteroidia bacterium]